jgi:hypothetical protein
MTQLTVLTAEEVERRFDKLGLPFRFAQNEKLETPPNPIPEQEQSIFAFPTPSDNIGLNLLNLRTILGVDPGDPPSFFDHPWYLSEAFGRADCVPGWHYLTMDVLPDSIGQPLNYRYSLRPHGLVLPSAVEVALMLFLHFAGAGEQLLHKKHTWCSDEASLGRFVTVGAFGRNGLFVSAHPTDFASRGLGMCAKWTSQTSNPFG